jgi:endonuclease/exonuclease/phosphatase family metal-dependent hydrolase
MAGTSSRQSKSGKQRKGRQGKNVFFGLTSRFLMLVVAVLLLVSYLSFLVNPAKLWLVSLLGLSFLPLLATNAFLLVWAVIRRSKAFVIPLLAILPCVFFLGRYVQFASEDEPKPDDADLKVVSYNIGRFSLSDKQSGVAGRQQCVDSVFAYLKNQDADIICLQEFYLSKENVKSYIRKHLPGYHVDYYLFEGRWGSFGNVTLSRIPVVGKGKIKFEESANLAIYTDYEIHGRRFRVYNCHFESYNISLPGIIRGILRADKAVVSDTGSKMKRSITRRPKQVDKVFSDIEKCPVESFVCGDFNDNPMSYSYFRMTRGRKDSFREAGHGFGATFARLWPLLRIDYILLPDRFKALTHETPRLNFSDHYPVITTIEL